MSNVKVEVCPSCKKLFHSLNGEKLCQKCKVEQADDFKVVKAYIRKHKGAGVEEVSRTCDVSHKQILEWVREERLYFDDASKVSLPCLRCGKNISIGKYCEDCLMTYQDEIKAIENRKEESVENSTYTYSKGKRNYFSASG